MTTSQGSKKDIDEISLYYILIEYLYDPNLRTKPCSF